MHGFPDRFLHSVQNECPVDIQGKEPLEGGIGMGGWAIAQSPILGTTITIQRLKKRLYESMLDVYFRINPSLYEPPRPKGSANPLAESNRLNVCLK
jgi:hypothetical protein